MSYPDLYSLSLRLPYPVFDTKGTAKYDKASKSLTVTLPVRPPPVAAMVAPSPVKTSDTAVSEVEAQGETEPASPQKPSTSAKKSSVGHGRWVESPATAATPAKDATAAPAESEGLSLHEEIKRQAEIALREAQAAEKAAPAVVTPSPSAAVAVSSPSAPPAPVVASVTGDFIASTTFGGKKAGYVFKRGDLGVGYYIDAKYAPKAPVAAAAPAPPSSATVVSASMPVVEEHLPFPFECRQTKTALALIVEVPNIDKASLRVEFESHSVRVSFRAFADVPVENGAVPSTTTVGAVQYGAELHLRQEDCPGGLDVSLCRFDAQKQNLAVVLTKAQAQFWHCSSPSTGTAESMRAEGESKSGDATSDEARRLLRVVAISTERASNTSSSVPSAGSADALPPPPQSTQKANAANAEVAKALKSLESTIQVMQFSSSDALFELD